VKKKVKNIQTAATRPQAERMLAIIRRIQKGDYPSRKDLARDLERTTRTIQRDITFMQNREGMPIAYDFHRHGYYLTEKLADFPLLQISEGEIVALFVAQRAMAQYHGTPFEQPLRLACEKLIEHLKGEFSVAWGDLDAAISFRHIETSPVDIAIFKDLSLAIQRRREVTFDYCKLGAKTFEKRRLRPYHLTCINYQWYVIGYDTLRKEMRRFVLGRMQSLQTLNATFIRPKTFSADKFLKGSFGVFSGDKPIAIRIWFDAFAARLVRERTWHHSQALCELPNDEIEITLTLTSIVEISRWILSWGTHVKALAPPELVKNITQTLQETMARYFIPGRAESEDSLPDAEPFGGAGANRVQIGPALSLK
jgi:predicted DNA-binding transcriptional regulator YafY